MKSFKARLLAEHSAQIKVCFLGYFLFSLNLDRRHFSNLSRRFRRCPSDKSAMISNIRSYTSSLLNLLELFVIGFFSIFFKATFKRRPTASDLNGMRFSSRWQIDVFNSFGRPSDPYFWIFRNHVFFILKQSTLIKKYILPWKYIMNIKEICYFPHPAPGANLCGDGPPLSLPVDKAE